MSNQNELTDGLGKPISNSSHSDAGLSAGGMHLSNTGLIAGEENSQSGANVNSANTPESIIQIQYVDENGNPISAFDENGNPIEYVDENGNPVQLFDDFGNPIEYVDENGNPVSLEGQSLLAESSDLVSSSLNTSSPASANSLETVSSDVEPATAKINTIGEPEKLNLQAESDIVTHRESILPSAISVNTAHSQDLEGGFDSFTTTSAPSEPVTTIIDTAGNQADLSSGDNVLSGQSNLSVDAERTTSESAKNNDDLENTITRRTALFDGEKGTSEVSPEPQWLMPENSASNHDSSSTINKLSLEEAMLEGATVRPSVPSRVRAHLWTLIASIILVPISWYLLADVSTRLRNPLVSPWIHGGGFNFVLGFELITGLVALFVVIWAARFSSLGTFLSGIIVTVIGMPFIFVPTATKQALQPFFKALNHAAEQHHFYDAFPANLAHHIDVSGSNGLILASGISLIALGFVSHGARRKGRKDYLIGQKVEAYIPELISDSNNSNQNTRKAKRAAKKEAKRAAKLAKNLAKTEK